MHRWAHALLGLLIAVMLPTAASAQASDDWAPQTFTLSNGMQAVVLPDHRSPVVTHMIWFRVGSADETPGKSGLAHFFEHLMFKATTTRPAGEYSKTVARNGGQMNGGTSFDFTNYHFRIAKDRLPLMMQLEADRLVNLALTEEDVTPERRVVQEERRQTVESNPSAMLNELVWAKLYAGHPYAVPIIGHMNEVAQLSRADALDWYRRWYGPENAILVVVGDVTAAELKPLAEKAYGDIQRRSDSAERPAVSVIALQQSTTVTHRDAKVRQANWSRNWLGVSIGDPDAAALQVGMQVLGGGRTSRLYRELVEGGVAVMAYGYTDEMKARGPLTVSASPAVDVTVEEVRDAAMKVIERFLRDGPTRQELERAKKMIAAGAIFRRDNQMEMAQWYGVMLAAGLSLDSIEQMDDAIARVTADDVRRAMRRYLAETRYVDGVLLPELP